jgi:hypothetical protein
VRVYYYGVFFGKVTDVKFPLRILLITLLALNASTSARAYVFTTNATGTPLRWATPVAPSFYTNWTNSDLLSYAQVFSVFTNSLQRWKNAGSSSVDFFYYQSGSMPTSWGLDGRNAIFFQSQAPSTQQLGGSTIGITYLFSNGSTIVESDIEFNDVNFTFTTNATDSSRYGAGTNVFSW